ncbi:MAG: arylsulfatase [Pirellulaceae bacterium]|nr:arylsulfatase [Planctomycetaceae bacterium]
MRCFAVFLLPICFLPSTLAAASPRQPNIILVMADDLGWSDIGCYGGEIGTPHIDSMARDGLRFTQFYNNSICGPTRASLLTGLYCQQIGHAGERWNEPKDFTKCVTIGEVLQQVGYRTLMVGKWQGRDSPLDRGFDRFFGPMCQAKISYFNEVQRNPYFLDRKRLQLPVDFYLTDALNEHAVQFLEESVADKAPFFLYVAHIAPHWPLHARPGEVAKYRERYRTKGWDQARAVRFENQRDSGLLASSWKLSPRPPAIGDWANDPYKKWQAERMAVYAAQVAAIDRGVGQLLEALRHGDELDNTLIMFLSDNGAAPDGGLAPSASTFGFGPKSKNDGWRTDGVPIRPGSGPELMPGPHNTFAAYGRAWASVSNTPLRGTKLDGFEGGIRTPLVVRWPEVIREQGGITKQTGHVIDFMATCLDVADASYPAEFQGRRPLPLEGKSLLPIFLGQRRQPHEVLCWSVPRHHAIRSGRWKAIRLSRGGQWQLYDLEADGTETTDLAEREPALVKELANRFEAWQTRVASE